MRLLIAIGLFMVSLTLLMLGVAERTVWAPPTSYKLSVQFETGNPFTIIPNSVLSLHPGTPVVTSSGPRNVFIATGRENDIMAWVSDTPHTLIEATKTGNRLSASSFTGPGSNYSPIGSDLWRTSVSGERKAVLASPSKLSGAVIIASDGSTAAPGMVDVVWPVHFDLFPSNLLIGIGFGVLLLALILNLISYRSLRKRRGPSRKVPKAPQGPRIRLGKSPRMAPARGRRSARKVVYGLSAGALTLALLTGCAPSQNQPSATPTPTTTVADPPVVNTAQLERILQQVATIVDEGDAKNDAGRLATRVAGPALAQRTSYFAIRKLDAKLAPLPKIAGKPITFILPAASTIWPRTIMAITDEAGTPSPQMLVLQQVNPRSQYLLWYNIRLMQGAKIPSVPVKELGAIPVDPAAKFVKVAPNELPKVYGNIIDSGVGNASGALFNVDNDEFYKQISESQASQVASLKNGKITFTHTLGSPNVLSLATTNSGALVAVSMIDGYTIRPTKKGSAITVTGMEKTLLGATGSPTGIVSNYSDMLLFFVPQSGSSAQVQLLGVTQGLLSVRSR